MLLLVHGLGVVSAVSQKANIGWWAGVTSRDTALGRSNARDIETWRCKGGGSIEIEKARLGQLGHGCVNMPRTTTSSRPTDFNDVS